MKTVLPGGSGQVGTLLARAFGAAGHEVGGAQSAGGARTLADRRLGRGDPR